MPMDAKTSPALGTLRDEVRALWGRRASWRYIHANPGAHGEWRARCRRGQLDSIRSHVAAIRTLERTTD